MHKQKLVFQGNVMSSCAGVSRSWESSLTYWPLQIMMLCCLEMLGFECWWTWRDSPEEQNCLLLHCKNLKSHWVDSLYEGSKQYPTCEISCSHCSDYEDAIFWNMMLCSFVDRYHKNIFAVYLIQFFISVCHLINFVCALDFWNRQLEWWDNLAAATGRC